MNVMNTPATLVGDREITATRLLDAPRELVFKLWTDPKHVARWWGPKGFTTTTEKMDLRPGGVWRFIMHGPDGTDYPNVITYQEIVAPSRLVYKHGNEKDAEPINFQVQVTFDDHGGKTLLSMRMTFPSAAAREHVITTYGAVDGLNQHVGRLADLLAEGASDIAASPPFVISRVFDAPLDRVWKAWTERDQLIRWFGPKGFTMSTAKLDFRPGGSFHYCLRSPDGHDMWGKFAYREIVPMERIVLVNSFSDEKGNVARHPGHAEWPLEMLSTTTFATHAGKGGGTVVTIHWQALDATAAEQKTFDTGHESMTMGWTGTFDQLADYLAKERS